MSPEERKELILAGAIEPISVTTKFPRGEHAYLLVTAKRTAMIESVVQHEKGGSKRKGVVTRAVVGGVLTMPLGIGVIGGIVGAATAGSKTNMRTVQKTVSKPKLLDSGELIFTNQRILFIGKKEIISVPYQSLIDYKFGWNLLGKTFTPRYEDMLPNESYIMSGPAAAEASDFFEGIIKNLVDTIA